MFPMRRLNRAERALNRGNTERAARKFHRLADQFDRRGDYAHAAAVRIEAAYAEAMGDDAAQAVRSTGYALTTLSNINPAADQNLRVSLTQMGPAIHRVADVLRQNGRGAEAAEVERMLGQALQAAGISEPNPVTPAQTAPVAAPAHGSLPASCEACGGPLLPGVVEWHDPSTAICPFCGSVVKAK
jgi:hypothetical protein